MMVNQAWIVVGNRDHLHEVMYMIRIVYAPLRTHGGRKREVRCPGGLDKNNALLIILSLNTIGYS